MNKVRIVSGCYVFIYLILMGSTLISPFRSELFLPVVQFNFIMDQSKDIVIVTTRIDRDILVRLTDRFKDMVKYVVDIDRRVAAVGGELHADAEEVLLEAGSRQSDLWGANYYPGRGRDGCIEYTSLINIRPSQSNRSMVVEDPATRKLIREITFLLIGEGEPL